MWNKNCGGYGAIMKKKKLNPYEKLKKALLIDHVLGLSFIMLIICLVFISLGQAVVLSWDILVFSVVGAAFAAVGSIYITGTIVKKRRLEFNCQDVKDRLLQANNVSFSMNNDEKESSIDKFLDGEVVVINDPELGEVHVQLIKENKDEKDNL